MHSVLYRHGVPRSRKLLTIALEMIDAIELQIGAVDLTLRAYARKQPGCRTLIDQIYPLGR